MLGRALGPQYEGDLFVGGARDFLEGGHLFHLNLTGNRRMVGIDDPRLEDRVADNPNKFSIVESEAFSSDATSAWPRIFIQVPTVICTPSRLPKVLCTKSSATGEESDESISIPSSSLSHRRFRCEPFS